MALQNVRSYGTEGRERELSTEDPNVTEKFVPPNDAIHPYLLFRGQDIKDLHVHENQTDTNVAPPSTATGDAPAVAAATTAAVVVPPPPANEATTPATTTTSVPKTASTSAAPTSTSHTHPRPSSTSGSGRGGGRSGGRSANGNSNSDARARTNNTRSTSNNNSNSAKEGTGASLLSRTVRGTNVSNDPSSTTEDFDFEQAATAATSSMVDTGKEDYDGSNTIDNVDHPTESASKVAYTKDDFFDSISCDAIDKQSGIDRRLRGQQERKLNTETFGAVALNNNSSNRYYNNRSRGGGSGNSGGRYNSGRSRGGRGRGYYSNTDNAVEGNTNSSSGNTRGGGGYRGSGRSGGGRSNYRGSGRNTGPRGSGSGRTSQPSQQPTSTTIAANAP